jgi:hypothetical protein
MIHPDDLIGLECWLGRIAYAGWKYVGILDGSIAVFAADSRCTHLSQTEAAIIANRSPREIGVDWRVGF